MKPNKQTYINFILNELEKGNVLYKDVYSVFNGKFHKTDRTFDKYWKLANTDYKERQEERNKQTLKDSIKAKKEVIKASALTKIDRIIIAEKIAMGKAKKVDGSILIPSYSDQLKALDYLAKIEADYAPTKTENKTINSFEMTDEQRAIRIKELIIKLSEKE